MLLLALRPTAAFNPASFRGAQIVRGKLTRSASLTGNIQNCRHHVFQMQTSEKETSTKETSETETSNLLIFEEHEEFIARSRADVENATAGLSYASSCIEKEARLVPLDADGIENTSCMLPWGRTVPGKDLGNGWVQFDDNQHFLPLKVGSVQVLHKVDQYFISERTKKTQKQLEKEMWKFLADAGIDDGGIVTYDELAELFRQQPVKKWLKVSNINMKRILDKMAQMPWTHRSATGKVSAKRFFQMLRQESLASVKMFVLKQMDEPTIKDISEFLGKNYEPSKFNATWYAERELRPRQEAKEGAEYATIIAKEDGEIIAHVGLEHWVSTKDGGIRWPSVSDVLADGEKVLPCLVSLTVGSNQRGRGLAHRLVEKAEELVKAWNRYDDLYLRVIESNKAALETYKNCGFRVFGVNWYHDTRGVCGQDEWVRTLLMKKPLSEPPQ